MEYIIVDGPWASGKSIIKGILDGHKDILTCMHQEPIFTAQAIKNRISPQELLRVLKLQELYQCYINAKIWWWFKDGDKVEVPYKWNPTKLIERIEQADLHSLNVVYEYVKFIKELKRKEASKFLIMEDFMQDKKIYNEIRKCDRYKIIIVDRNQSDIIQDILNRTKYSILKSQLKRLQLKYMIGRYYSLWKKIAAVDSNVKFIKFELLFQCKSETINEISKFVGIEYTESMNECTFDGVKIISNKGIQYL